MTKSRMQAPEDLILRTSPLVSAKLALFDQLKVGDRVYDVGDLEVGVVVKRKATKMDIKFPSKDGVVRYDRPHVNKFIRRAGK